MSRFLFSGVNLAITTPFDHQGKPDLERLEALLEQYLAAGVSSFVLSSGTGMHVYLTGKESQSVIARGAKVINGRAKIIVQASALLTEDVLNRVRFARDCGADGVMVLPPFFEGPTDDEGIIDFYQEIASGGLPIIGYNVPQAVGVAITPDLLRKLCEIPEFIAVKDSSGDLAQQEALIRTGLPVMNGADALVPYALFAGASGLIWGGANFAPRAAVEIAREAQAGNWSAVQEIWQFIAPAMSLIWQGDYVQSVYAAAEILGYGAGQPRKPLARLPQHKLAILQAALEPLQAYEKR